MTINSAIHILDDLSEQLLDMPDEVLEDGILTDPRYAKTKALELAVRVLTALEDNRAKAENIITSYKNCYTRPMRCEGCIYNIEVCLFQRDLDAEHLLEQLYPQGGDDDVEP